jgi:hypothetical protein
MDIYGLSQLEAECKAIAAELRGTQPATRKSAVEVWAAECERQADEFRVRVAAKSWIPRRFADGLEIKIV